MWREETLVVGTLKEDVPLLKKFLGSVESSKFVLDYALRLIGNGLVQVTNGLYAVSSKGRAMVPWHSMPITWKQHQTKKFRNERRGTVDATLQMHGDVMLPCDNGIEHSR